MINKDIYEKIFASKYIHCKLKDVALVNLETIREGRYNIEFKVYGDIDQIVAVDEDSEIAKLKQCIRAQLKALEPWYLKGKVGSPMDAVEALRNIDRLVKL